MIKEDDNRRLSSLFPGKVTASGTNTDMANIPILGHEIEADDTKQALPAFSPDRIVQKVATVGSEVLASNIKTFLTSFQEVLQDADRSYGGFRLEELELSLAVDASGRVSLVGEMAGGVSTSLVLRLRREKKSK